MRSYAAFFKGRRIDFQASDLWAAKQYAVAQFKAPKSQQSQIAVILSDVLMDPAAL
jgi:hypothetical protein